MLDRPEDFDSAFLASSEESARRTRDERIAVTSHDKLLVKRLLRFVDDPFLRPITELLHNGATSYERALVLKERRFLDVREFVARAGPLEGEMIEIVRLTDAALLFAEEASELPDDDSFDLPFDAFEAFLEGIRGYLAIDRGNGIVVTRDLAEVALDLEDGDLLNRLMSLKRYERQVRYCLPSNATPAFRLEAERYWSSSDGPKRGGAHIIDLANLQHGTLGPSG